MEQKHLNFKQVNGLVSVILPTYNSENYLDDCLRSILKQTYKKIELIVIDGLSSDDTIKIIKKYKKFFPIKIIQQKTNNLAEALNIAIANSQGEYIARMDSDDIMISNRIQKQVNFFIKNKFIGVLGTQSFRFKKYYLKPFLLHLNSDYLHLSIFFESPFVHPSVMFNREIFEKGNFYNESYDECEDFELWSKLSSIYNFKNIISFGLLYRVHEDSASNKKSKKLSIFKKKIIEKNLSFLNLHLTKLEIQEFLKIVSLNIDKNDDFNNYNRILIKVMLHIEKNHNLLNIEKKYVVAYLKKKYFRICLRLLKCSNFDINTIKLSAIKISFLKILFLNFLSILNLHL